MDNRRHPFLPSPGLLKGLNSSIVTRPFQGYAQSLIGSKRVLLPKGSGPSRMSWRSFYVPRFQGQRVSLLEGLLGPQGRPFQGSRLSGVSWRQFMFHAFFKGQRARGVLNVLLRA